VDFYLDASIPFPVSQALALVRDDVLYPGSPGCPITTPDVRTMNGFPSPGTMDGLSLCATSMCVHDLGSGARYGTTASGRSCSPVPGTTRDGARSTFLSDGGPTLRASLESRRHPTCTPSPSKGCGGSSLVPAVEPPYSALPSIPTWLIDRSKDGGWACLDRSLLAL
jgi:hypothetical protein